MIRTRIAKAANPGRSQHCSCSCGRKGVGLCLRRPGSSARDGSPPTDRAHNGGLAHPHGASAVRGQVLPLVTGGAGGGARAVLLRDLSIPAAGCFRQLGVGVAVGAARSTQPVLAGTWKPSAVCCDMFRICPRFSGGCVRSTPW